MSKTFERKKIPARTEAEVMFQSDLQCCVDQKRGVHIHHIDGNPGNNSSNNLALLCFECHDRATITGSLSKKLSAGTIRKYLEHHYDTIQRKRRASLEIVTELNSTTNYADSLNVAIQANVLVEIAKVKSQYDLSILMDRNDILVKLLAFKEYNFPRVCFELFEFLEGVTYETRSGLPLKMIKSITWVVEGYFPPNAEDVSDKQLEEIGKMAIQIAFGIIYDTSIHSHKYHSMMEGYDLLKYIHGVVSRENNHKLKELLSGTIDEIKSTLSRPERKDLGMANQMFDAYKNAIDSNLRVPHFTNELRSLINQEERE